MGNEPWRGFLPESVVKETRVPIFHYTDGQGLLGIVQNKALWATEASGLNDVAEVTQGWDFIRTWLSGCDQADRVISDMSSIAGVNSSDDDGDWVRSRDGVYVCSASLLGDDANQWRLYGGAARGYSVELNPAIRLAPFANGPRPLKLRLRRGNRDFWVTPIAPTRVSPWLHVLYADGDKEAALGGLTEMAWAELRRIDASVASGELDQEAEGVERQVLQATLRTDMALLASLMKSAGFAGEQEVRMVVTAAESSVSHFRSTPRGVVRYSRLVTVPKNAREGLAVHAGDFPQRKKVSQLFPLPIRSVTIGPLVRTSNNRASIEALLSGYPGRPSVKSSDVPLSG